MSAASFSFCTPAESITCTENQVVTRIFDTFWNVYQIAFFLFLGVYM